MRLSNDQHRQKPTVLRTRRVVHLLGAIAAVIVVIVMLTPLMRQERKQERDRPEAHRVSQLRSLVPAGEPLPRRRCLLRWSALPEGTLYTLEVKTEELALLHRVEHLAETEYRVPESALRDLPPGAAFLWQVEALLTDGNRLSSPAFRGTLE